MSDSKCGRRVVEAGFGVHEATALDCSQVMQDVQRMLALGPRSEQHDQATVADRARTLVDASRSRLLAPRTTPPGRTKRHDRLNEG